MRELVWSIAQFGDTAVKRRLARLASFRRWAVGALVGLLALVSSPAWTASAQVTAAAVEVAGGLDAHSSPPVLQVAANVYLVKVGGVNVVVQAGLDGAVVVNTGAADQSATLIRAVRQLSSQPIRYVIDTSADADLIGGNPDVARAGTSILENNILDAPPNGAIRSSAGLHAIIVAHQSVLTRLVPRLDAGYPEYGLPNETYTRPAYDFFLNGEPISVIWQPAAHSDGDSVVRFEHSDVVVAGAIFDDTRFPVIDVRHGGSIEGEIDALNKLLNELTFSRTPLVTDTGGTLVVPIRGPICDQSEVLNYRDMVGTMRDRVRDLINQGKSLAQVHAANPAQGFRSRYGTDDGSWTTDDFIDAVYDSLIAERRAHGPRR